jgi:glucosamine--fructose-6-phosphate aminotransferase (isomerizing)
VAHWLNDKELLDALQRLPVALAAATRIEWPAASAQIAEASSLYVLGRGPSFPIAQEAALKLKETCALHAEAYSIAEVMHGPWELVEHDFPVLAFSPNDAARPLTRSALGRIRAAGARVLAVEQDGLPYAETGHPLLDPISMILTCYLAIERLAVSLGRDPDKPRLLKKVTETL